jgi:hypothetical protein
MKSGNGGNGNKLDLDMAVAQSEGMPFTYIGDEIAFMNIENSKYYGLDSVGTRIWTLIERPRRIGEVVDELLREYSVERTTCEDHVLEFMEKLLEEKLIRIVAET